MNSVILTVDSANVTSDSGELPKIGHDESEWPVTFLRNQRSRSIGMCGHVGAEYAKEIKQEIGSAKSQVRNAHAVINHLNFCMMATTLTWIYADRIKADPERRHLVKGRTSFAFSDVRRLITNAALYKDFLGLWPQQPKPQQNSFVALLLRMVA